MPFCVLTEYKQSCQEVLEVQRQNCDMRPVQAKRDFDKSCDLTF